MGHGPVGPQALEYDLRPGSQAQPPPGPAKDIEVVDCRQAGGGLVVARSFTHCSPGPGPTFHQLGGLQRRGPGLLQRRPGRRPPRRSAAAAAVHRAVCVNQLVGGHPPRRTRPTPTGRMILAKMLAGGSAALRRRQ
jgi:hypothetical protein